MPAEQSAEARRGMLGSGGIRRGRGRQHEKRGYREEGRAFSAGLRTGLVPEDFFHAMQGVSSKVQYLHNITIITVKIAIDFNEQMC